MFRTSSVTQPFGHIAHHTLQAPATQAGAHVRGRLKALKPSSSLAASTPSNTKDMRAPQNTRSFSTDQQWSVQRVYSNIWHETHRHADVAPVLDRAHAGLGIDVARIRLHRNSALSMHTPDAQVLAVTHGTIGLHGQWLNPLSVVLLPPGTRYQLTALSYGEGIMTTIPKERYTGDALTPVIHSNIADTKSDKNTYFCVEANGHRIMDKTVLNPQAGLFAPDGTHLQLSHTAIAPQLPAAQRLPTSQHPSVNQERLTVGTDQDNDNQKDSIYSTTLTLFTEVAGDVSIPQPTLGGLIRTNQPITATTNMLHEGPYPSLTSTTELQFPKYKFSPRLTPPPTTGAAMLRWNSEQSHPSTGAGEEHYGDDQIMIDPRMYRVA